jgi:hypothetical protein
MLALHAGSAYSTLVVHARPHAPQLVTLEETSTHREPHTTQPTGAGGGGGGG